MKTRENRFVFLETFVKGIRPHFFVHDTLITVANYKTALVKIEE